LTIKRLTSLEGARIIVWVSWSHYFLEEAGVGIRFLELEVAAAVSL
jgi:hypothetical protein